MVSKKVVLLQNPIRFRCLHIYMGLYKIAIIQLALLTIPECTGFGQAKPSICQAGPSPGLLCSLSPD